ncbi:hypothetical protein WN51_01252 [Melipona quadrifasciata]|uniref:Uncharacterized protein n=1 Tax=Melipona quadrifasciata TaxID=166423 RepID=A0A0M8ZX28_9HYME|nr:hypothetical protein WN51_01252 [Melipona quadrifasciata]
MDGNGRPLSNCNLAADQNSLDSFEFPESDLNRIHVFCKKLIRKGKLALGKLGCRGIQRSSRNIQQKSSSETNEREVSNSEKFILARGSRTKLKIALRDLATKSFLPGQGEARPPTHRKTPPPQPQQPPPPPPPYDTFFPESGRESNPAPLSFFPPWALLGFSLENVQCCEPDDPAGRARFGSCPRTIDPILRRRFSKH